MQTHGGELVSISPVSDNIDKVEEVWLPKSLHSMIFSMFTLPGVLTICARVCARLGTYIIYKARVYITHPIDTQVDLRANVAVLKCVMAALPYGPSLAVLREAVGPSNVCASARANK
jgi:hypothetical protein